MKVKRNTKRFLALFLAFAMAVTPVTSLHAEDTVVQEGESAAVGTEAPQEEEPSVSEPKETVQTPETENQDTKKEPETEAPEQTEDLTDEGGNQSQDTQETTRNPAVYAAKSEDVPVVIDDTEIPVKPAKEITGLKVLKNDGTPYGMFPVADAEYEIIGDKIQISFNTGTKTTYSRLYLGYQTDEDKTDYYTGNKVGSTCEFTIQVPLSQKNSWIPISVGKDDGTWYGKFLWMSIPNVLTLTQQPQSVNAKEGESASLSVAADGNGVTYQWQYSADGQTWTECEGLGAQTATYSFTMANDLAGQYRCVVTDTEGTSVTSSVSTVSEPSAPVVTGSNVRVVKSDGTDFKMFTVGESSVVKDGNNLDITSSTANVFYDKLYQGVQSDSNKTPVYNGSYDTETGLTTFVVTVPADGDYKVDVESSASMFKIIDCRLTVKDGQMSAVLTLSGTGYGYLYMGTAEEAAAADLDTWIPFVEDSDGKYTYTVPVEALDTGIAVAAYSKKNKIWYDRTLTFQSEGMEAVKPTIEDGTYSIEVETGASMFKVVGAVLTVKDGKMSAVITLSGQGYDYLYMGTKEDAASAVQDAWIPYVADSEGKYTYTVPVEALDTALVAASHSSSRNQWYDRTLTFNSETLKKLSDLTGGGDSGTSGGAGTGDGTGSSTVVKPNDGNADSESKYEADVNGSTGRVNNSTTLADGVYTPDAFTWSGGTGKVKIYCNKVTITNGQAYATLVFDSDHYQYVKANGNIYYTTKGNGTATVVIPVALNQNNRILAMTTKMSNTHEIAYTIFVYLAGAGNGQGVVSTTNKKLDEEAPEIMGLTYESETVLDYAEYFKIFHYDQGITLLEVDTTRDTARDPEKLEDAEDTADTAKEQKEEEKQMSEEEIVSEEASADEEETVSQEEMAAELYKGNVVKYLLVPEGVEVTVGLDQDMIVVQLPVDKTYVSDEALLEKMDELGLTDDVAAVGTEEKDCKVASIAEKMEKKDGEEKAEVSYGGAWEDPDFKELVKQETNLALFPAQLLPRETEGDDAKEEDQKSDDEELTVEEQTERFEEITEKLAMLGIPAIVDRSEDEKTDLAKAEWVKVYGVLFGCEEEMSSIFDAAVEEAGER